MNPLTNVKNITKLNETELATGLIHKKSWHDMYKDSAWIFIGGLEYGLTEGDVIAVFSQYGEIENINLVRDKKTGKSKGYCFLCYSNQKSTVLAVDNFNGIKLCNRTIRVDHVANYKPPKENERDDEVTKILKSEGCAPRLAQKLLSRETSETKNDDTTENRTKKKKTKKEKKEKKKKKRKQKSDYDDSDKEIHATKEIKIKKEKHDSGYDKYDSASHTNFDVNKKRYHEKRIDCSNGEYSYSKKSDRTLEYISISKNNISDKDKPKIKSETESRSKNNSDIHLTLSKKHKRKRSSSSSAEDHHHQTSANRRNYKHKNDTDELKRHLKYQKKSAKVKDCSSSSSDDASSTQSSSEDDRYSSKDTHKTIYKNQESIRNYYRNGDTSTKNKLYDKLEKHVEHKSRTKYKASDRDDRYYKDSHYQKKEK